MLLSTARCSRSRLFTRFRLLINHHVQLTFRPNYVRCFPRSLRYRMWCPLTYILLYYPPLYGPENATALYRRFRVSAMQATFLTSPSKEGFFINVDGCALFDSIKVNPYTMSHHQFSYFYYCRQTTKRIYEKYIYK